jgi:hypothetical protein
MIRYPALRYAVFLVRDSEFLMRPCFAAAMAARLAVVALPLVAASCASAPPASPPGVPAAAVGAATVLTVRPIAATGADDAPGWRSALLNGASESGAPPPTGALAEFIVRADDGATLSIVQPNDAGLHVGDRVTLARPSAATGSPRLVRQL